MIVLSLPLHVLKWFNATIINNRYPSAISTFVEKWCILTTSNNSTHLNDENPSNWSSGDAVDGVAGRELRHSCCEARHARFEGGHPVELSDLSAIDHKALTFNNLISYCHDQTLVAKDFQAPSTWQLFLRGGPWDLPDAARRPRTCWTLRNTTEMVEMEIGEKHLLIFRILQTSFQYALFCQSVNEYCALIYWYTVLYSFWACNGDEPALLRHRAQLQTGQKGVVDLSVWSEIFWNIYLGPISNGRSTACESWINVQGRFKVQVESLRVNLQVQTKYI